MNEPPWGPTSLIRGPVGPRIRKVARSPGRTPGLRHPYYGTLYNVGQNGYSYSSSVSGSNGLFLDFNNARVTPQNSNNRAYGFQVRCLQVFIHPRTRCAFGFFGRGGDTDFRTGRLFRSVVRLDDESATA